MRATTIESQTTLLHGCGLHKFHVTDVQNTRNQLQVIEGPNARDKIALSAFHLFLVCDYASYIHATHA